MLDDKTLQFTKKEIERDLGTLDDLPHDLANTIANYYYKSFEIASGVAESKVFQNKDLRQGLTSYVYEAETIINFIKIIPELIKSLRKIDRHKLPRAYSYLVNYYLDLLKYNIPNASKKSHIRRQFERFFRGQRITEIPDLINYIQKNK